MPCPDSVAVVTINWNGWRHTLACLSALRASVGADWHLFIVDNGSTDDSVARLRDLGPDTTLIEAGANLGWTGGNNLGLRHVLDQDLEHIFILNNDAFVHPDTLARLVAASRQATPRPVLGAYHKGAKTSDYDFCGAHIEPRTGIPAWNDIRMHQPPGDGALVDTAYVGGAALFMHRDHLRTVGFFDDRFFLNFDDTDWCARAKKAGFPLKMVGGAVVDHEGSASIGGRHAPLQTYFLTRNKLLYAQKHATPVQRLRLMRHIVWQAKDLAPGRGLMRYYNGLRARHGLSAALRLGIVDYFAGRFGDCPAVVRQWQADHARTKTAAAPATDVDVTAIVPTYNRANYLGETLESILGQTQRPRQLVIVDDGSSDGTQELVARYGDRVQYVRQDNAGKASALNLALRHAEAAAIWVVDDDDIPVPTALAQLSHLLASSPEAGFAGGHYDHFTVDASGAKRFSAVGAPTFDVDDLFAALLERCFIFQPALLVQRRAYDAVGAFDPDFVRAQDYDMLLRLAAQFPGAYVPELLFHQRCHTGLRGTASEPIDGQTIWSKQDSYDSRVMRKTYDRVPLHWYLPRSERTAQFDDHAQYRARFRRGAVLARRLLWTLAIDDFDAAFQIAQRNGWSSLPPAETQMLNRVFDEFGAAHRALDDDNPLLLAIADLPPSKLRDTVFAALLWPTFRYLLKGAVRADVAAAARHAQTYRRFSHAMTLPRHMTHAVANQFGRFAQRHDRKLHAA
jgi:GT2 family glycosyltransferase